VQVFSLDRERALAELRRDCQVEAVALFGSLAQGRAIPGSDADVLVLLRAHPQARWFDRIPDYALAAGLPVEVFPFTWAELQRGAQSPGLIRTILRTYLPLAGRPSALERLQQLRETVLLSER
jgi:predicted nucleotidyltransferase